MPNVGGMKFGYSALEKLKAKKYAKKTGKKLRVAGAIAKAKAGGMMSGGPKKKGDTSKRAAAARKQKRTTDARAKAQAKRASRAQAARTQRMKAKSKKR